MKVLKLFIGGLIVMLVVMLALPGAFAGGITQSNDMNNQTTGDVKVGVSTTTTVNGGDMVSGDMVGGDTNVSTGGNKALALANSLGDVDIAGCLGSTQWNTPVFGKQKLVLNQVCMAEFYLTNEKWELAAMALCNVPEILKEFDDEAHCETAHNFGPIRAPESAPAEAPEPVSEILYQQQIIETEHDEDIQLVQMAQNDIAHRIEALEQQAEAPPPAPVIIEQRPAYTDEDAQKIWAILDQTGDNEDE